MLISDRSDNHHDHVSARTSHRRRRHPDLLWKPAAASGMRPSRMHVIMKMPLAGSPAVANRPAEAARCLEVACEHPGTSRCKPTIRICRSWRENSAHTAGTCQYTTHASLIWEGCDLLAPLCTPCGSLPPHRWTSRGRMPGLGATCTAPTTHGRPTRMIAPDYCKIGAA